MSDETPTLRYDTVTLLTDYGTADGFVGILHSVLRQLAPGVGIVDLTHEVAPFDVRGGSLVLARAVQYLCPGVVVAVVDPGVGSERRPVAVEVGGGAAVLVGPDNGLLAAAVAMVGGADRAVVLDRPEYHLPSASTTFDGRDVFAPVAAHLCRGVPFEEVGTPIDAAGLVPGLVPLTRLEDGRLHAEVLAVDRFGNVQLNVDPDEAEELGPVVSVRVEDRERTARLVRSFGEVGPGALGVLVDSDGLLAVVCDRASAAELLALGPGDAVVLAAADEVATAPVVTEVRLGKGPGAGDGDPSPGGAG